jgi:PleD family two-component response regulator
LFKDRTKPKVVFGLPLSRPAEIGPPGEQPLSPIRILVADDFENWRRQVRLLFQARPAWQVIAEASDGSEAVQKAEELKPDFLYGGAPSIRGLIVTRGVVFSPLPRNPHEIL